MISSIWGKLKSAILAAKEKGLLHVIISSMLVKIVGFMSSFFLPRILSKADFSLLSYVENINGYVLLLNAFGLCFVTLRYCSKRDTDEEKKAVFLYCLKWGIIIDLGLIIGTLIVYSTVTFPMSGANALLVMFAPYPLIFFFMENMQFFFRGIFEVKKYSVTAFLYSFLTVLFQVILGILIGLRGVVLGKYISMCLVTVLCFILYKKLPISKVKAVSIAAEEKKKMIMLGINFMFSGAASILMTLNSTFVVGNLIEDKTTLADYRVATYILQITYFFVQALVIVVLPYFSRHSDDRKWIQSKYKQLMSYNGLLMIALHGFLLIFTRPLVMIVFSEKYLPAVPIMQILLIASFFQTTLRHLAANILVAIGHEKVNLIVNVVSMIAHLIITVISVKFIGVYGAALSLVIIYCISGMYLHFYLKHTIKINTT